MISSLLGLAQSIEQSGEWMRMSVEVAFKGALLLLMAVTVNLLLRRAAAATRLDAGFRRSAAAAGSDLGASGLAHSLAAVVAARVSDRRSGCGNTDDDG